MTEPETWFVAEKFSDCPQPRTVPETRAGRAMLVFIDGLFFLYDQAEASIRACAYCIPNNSVCSEANGGRGESAECMREHVGQETFRRVMKLLRIPLNVHDRKQIHAVQDTGDRCHYEASKQR